MRFAFGHPPCPLPKQPWLFRAVDVGIVFYHLAIPQKTMNYHVRVPVLLFFNYFPVLRIKRSTIPPSDFPRRFLFVYKLNSFGTLERRKRTINLTITASPTCACVRITATRRCVVIGNGTCSTGTALQLVTALQGSCTVQHPRSRHVAPNPFGARVQRN